MFLPLNIILASLLLSTSILAEIHQYNDEVLPLAGLTFRKSAMFAPHDTPEGEGQESFIKVDLTFKRSVPEYYGEPIKIQLAVFDEQAWQHLATDEVVENGTKYHVYCCTKTLMKQGICDKELSLILREDVDKGTYVQDVEFPVSLHDSTKTGSVRVQRKFIISTKGMKYVLFASCNDLAGQILINGAAECKNPYGYLPGELHGMLSFFAKMALAYTIVAILWSLACVRAWRELMVLQTFASGALTLGIIEMGIRYYDFDTFNTDGTREPGLLIASSLSIALKQTSSRVFALIMAMGYGVVKPSLESHTWRSVLALGGLFFICTAVQRMRELLPYSKACLSVTLVSITVLNLTFAVWTFFSLQHVITFLADRQANTIKLSLYKKFRWVLVSTMLAGLVLSYSYAFVVQSGRRRNYGWKKRWMYDDDVWFNVLDFTSLLTLLFLLRPVGYASDYAYRPFHVKRVGSNGDDNAKLTDEEEGNDLQAQANLLDT